MLRSMVQIHFVDGCGASMWLMSNGLSSQANVSFLISSVGRELISRQWLKSTS